MAQDRSEYYKQLYQNRQTNNRLGNPLVNPSNSLDETNQEFSALVRNSTMPNVNTKSLEYLSAGQIEEDRQRRALEEYKASRDGWQRFWDTISDFNTEVTTGFVNFLDKAKDAIVGFTGFFGNDDYREQVQKNIADDEWVKSTADFLSRASSYVPSMMSGDIFNGQFWQTPLGEYNDKLKASSYINEWNEDAQNISRGIAQGIGEYLPQVAVGIATGGTSVPAQMAIQGGISAVEGYGSGLETAFQEGADFYSGQAYGATQGAISGALTALTTGIGGSIFANTGGIATKGGELAGNAIYKMTKNATLQVIFKDIAEVATRAGIQATTAFGRAMLDPVVKSIYTNGDSIAEAYGDNDKLLKTLKNAGISSATAFATSLIIGAGRKGIDVAKEGGMTNYVAKYNVDKAIKLSNSLEEEIKKLAENQNLSQKEINERIAEIKETYNKINDYTNRALRVYKNYASKKGITADSLRDENGKLIIDNKQISRLDSVNATVRNKLLRFQNEMKYGTWYNEDGTEYNPSQDTGNVYTETPSSNKKMEVVAIGKKEFAVMVRPEDGNIGDIAKEVPTNNVVIPTTNGNNLILPTQDLSNKEIEALNNIRENLKEVDTKDGDYYVLKVDENETIKWKVDEYNPTAIFEIDGKEVDKSANINPLKDPSGYITTTDKRKIGLTNGYKEALDELQNESLNYEDYRTQGNDYSDGYISKRYVNRLNNWADKLLTRLRDFYDDSMSIEDIEDFENLKQFVQEYANEDFYNSLQELIDEVDYGEYPNDEPPDTSYIQELVDYLTDLENNIETLDEDFNNLKSTNEKNKNLKVTVNNGNSLSYNNVKEQSNDTRRIEAESQNNGERPELKGSNPRGNGKEAESLYSILGLPNASGRDTSGLGVVKGSYNSKYFTDLNGTQFHKVFSNVYKDLNLAQQCIVDLHPVEDYQDGKTFVREDGKAVGFITDDGNIISVANSNTKVKGFAKDFLDYAVKNGGNHLDCMSSNVEGTINLPYTYSKNGFIPIAKVKYDRDIMLESHSKEMVDAFENEFGKADLIFMAYSGTNKPYFPKSIGGRKACQEFIDNLNYVDYETALKTQQEMVENGGVKYPTTRRYEDGIRDPNKIKDINPALIPLEYIKDSADLHNSKVWNYKEAERTIRQITKDIYNAKLVEEKDARITYDGKGILKASDELVRLIDKKNVTPEEVVNGLQNIFKNISITSKKNSINLTELEKDPAILETIKKNVEELLQNKGKIGTTKFLTELYKKARLLYKNEIVKRNETVKSIRLIDKIQNKIDKGTRTYFSAPFEGVGELKNFGLLIDEVKAPFTPKTLKQLTTNIDSFYTEDNFGELYKNNGMELNPLVKEYNENLKASIGSKTTTENLQNANAILTLIYKDMQELAGEVNLQNRKYARENVVLTQPIVDNKKIKNAFIESSINLIKGIDRSIRSPAHLIETELGDIPLIKNITDDIRESTNNYIADRDELTNSFFVDEKHNFDKNKIETALKKKIDFKGHKIKVDRALNILALNETYGDKIFFESGGSLKVGGTQVDIDLDKDDVNDLIEQIRNLDTDIDLLDWYKFALNNGFNNEASDYIHSAFKQNNGVDLPPLPTDTLYYPASRIGDKAYVPNTNAGARILDNSLYLNYFKPRSSSSRNRINFDRDFSKVIGKYIDDITKYKNYAPWMRKFLISLNTRVFGKDTSEFHLLSQIIPNFEKTLDLMIKQVAGIPVDASDNLLSYADNIFGGLIGNLSSMALISPFTQLKTLGSAFTGVQYWGSKTSAEGAKLYAQAGGLGFAEKKAKEIVDKYSKILSNRFKTDEALIGSGGKSLHKIINKYGFFPMRTGDMAVHLGISGFYSAKAQVLSENKGNPISEDEINRLAVKKLEKWSTRTQPVTQMFEVSPLRAGAYGKVLRYAFGMFGSMSQNIYQGLVDITYGWYKGVQRTKAYEDAYEENLKKIDEYSRLEEEYTNKANETEDETLKAEYEGKAKDARWHKEGHEDSAETLKNAINNNKKKYNWKSWFNKSSAYLFGLVGSGLVLTAISLLKKRVYGKEEWGEWNPQQFTLDSTYASFVNWMPYIGTITNAVRNNNDLSVFTIDNVNNRISMVKTLAEAIQSGDMTKISGATLKALMDLSSYFGIPAKALWDVVNGVWYNVDHESNLRANNWLGMIKSSTLKNNMYDGFSKGLRDKSIANMKIYMYQNSIAQEDKVYEEIYRLGSNGIRGHLPKSVLKSYENEKGETINLTTSQKETFAKYYSLMKKEALKLITSDEYKSLDDEYKGKALKRLYDYYYEFAKSMALKEAGTSKITNLLATTKGNLSLGKYAGLLSKFARISSTKEKTRKQQILEELNKMKYLTKQEKLLITYIEGLSLTAESKATLGNFLIKLGGNKQDIKELLK